MLAADSAAPQQAAIVIVGDVTVYLPLADFVDVAAECERLGKERDKLAEQIARSQAQLGNEQFVSARPPGRGRARADALGGACKPAPNRSPSGWPGCAASGAEYRRGKCTLRKLNLRPYLHHRHT